MKKFVLVILIFVVIASLALGMVMMNYTKIDALTPVFIALGVVAVLWPLLRKLWLRHGVWFGVAGHVIVVGSLAFALFLGLNAAFASEESHSETGHVVEKYSKEHERRGGRRNRHVLGHYRTYHLKVQMPDSQIVVRDVQFETYRRTKIGAPVSANVRKGLFGYEVVKFGKKSAE